MKGCHYYRNTRFLEPFIKACKGLTPIHRLVAVKGYSVPLDKEAQTDGSLGRFADKAEYVMMLRLYGARTRKIDKPKNSFQKTRHERVCWEHILWTLAHELAHLKHWDHNADHAILTGKLFSRMARKARELGLEDLSSAIPPEGKML